MCIDDGSVVKNLPVMQETQETQLLSLHGEDPLEEGGGHGNPLQYSCLEDPMDRRAGWLQSIESQRVGHD